MSDPALRNATHDAHPSIVERTKSSRSSAPATGPRRLACHERTLTISTRPNVGRPRLAAHLRTAPTPTPSATGDRVCASSLSLSGSTCTGPSTHTRVAFRGNQPRPNAAFATASSSAAARRSAAAVPPQHAAPRQGSLLRTSEPCAAQRPSRGKRHVEKSGGLGGLGGYGYLFSQLIVTGV